MTRARDVLEDLVAGRTYQIGIGRSGDQVRWHLSRLYLATGELALIMPEGFTVWREVATRTVPAPADGRYRESGMAWLRELGHDTDRMDLLIVLPDGYDRQRSAE